MKESKSSSRFPHAPNRDSTSLFSSCPQGSYTNKETGLSDASPSRPARRPNSKRSN